MLSDNLIEIASCGGGFIINAYKYPTQILKEIATSAGIGGGYIILKNIGPIPTQTLKEIAACGKGHIIFDLYVS